MDGTLFDPWACHGYAGNHPSSDGCTHVRADTLAAVRRICRAADAQPVVLSWRAGLHQVTADWLVEIGLEVAAIFIPGSADDLVDGHVGQVGSKRATVEALQSGGVDIVASFDDNPGGDRSPLGRRRPCRSLDRSGRGTGYCRDMGGDPTGSIIVVRGSRSRLRVSTPPSGAGRRGRRRDAARHS